ncbi:hypothetical protein H920_02748 [Fukomys damarensis]|uniref:Uncharacterized protein n=1 Tax=Fukomys damarensis TaxID=885580 RepID=A0A091EK29_FUKDA|nr:hypothetical protein H920_02748 [Fukomys damarensis]
MTGCEPGVAATAQGSQTQVQPHSRDQVLRSLQPTPGPKEQAECTVMSPEDISPQWLAPVYLLSPIQDPGCPLTSHAYDVANVTSTATPGGGQPRVSGWLRVHPGVQWSLPVGQRPPCPARPRRALLDGGHSSLAPVLMLPQVVGRRSSGLHIAPENMSYAAGRESLHAYLSLEQRRGAHPAMRGGDRAAGKRRFRLSSHLLPGAWKPHSP